jgi:hypothetical protein
MWMRPAVKLAVDRPGIGKCLAHLQIHVGKVSEAFGGRNALVTENLRTGKGQVADRQPAARICATTTEQPESLGARVFQQGDRSRRSGSFADTAMCQTDVMTAEFTGYQYDAIDGFLRKILNRLSA